MAALLGALAGLIAGSFIAALTWRWPQGRSIAAGRSACDACAVVLSPLELVPVVSFLFLRGRCRRCGAAIPLRHLLIELAAAAIGGLALALAPSAAGVAGALFGWALLALAILDAEHFWLPDAILLPLGLAGVAAAWVTAPPLADRLLGAAGGFAVLAAIRHLYRWRSGRHGMGGGDPKLLAAIGAWLGWQALPQLVLAAALLGLGLLGIDRLRGRAVARHDRVAFGSLLAATAWPLWLLLSQQGG